MEKCNSLINRLRIYIVDQNLWEKIRTMSYLGIWKSYQFETLVTKSVGHTTTHRLRV